MDNNLQPTPPVQNQKPINDQEIINALNQQELRNKDQSKSGISKIIIIAAVFIVIILVVIGLFAMGRGSSSKTPVANNTPVKPKVDSVNPENTIVQLEKWAIYLHGKQSNYKYEVSKATLDFNPTDGVVIYKVDGIDYFVKSNVQTKGAFNHKIDPVKSDADSYAKYITSAKITADLLSSYATDTLKFKKIDSITIKSEAVDLKYNIFSKDDIICSIQIDPDYAINASCVSKDKLTKASEEVKPFVDLYLKTGKHDYDYYGPTKVTDGKNDYKITKLSTNFGPLDYVKKSDQKDWKLIGAPNYQSITPCEFYTKDPDAKLAFQGETCADSVTNTESTVK